MLRILAEKEQAKQIKFCYAQNRPPAERCEECQEFESLS